MCKQNINLIICVLFRVVYIVLLFYGCDFCNKNPRINSNSTGEFYCFMFKNEPIFILIVSITFNHTYCLPYVNISVYTYCINILLLKTQWCSLQCGLGTPIPGPAISLTGYLLPLFLNSFAQYTTFQIICFIRLILKKIWILLLFFCKYCRMLLYLQFVFYVCPQFYFHLFALN